MEIPATTARGATASRHTRRHLVVSDFVLGRMSCRMSMMGYERFSLCYRRTRPVLLADTGAAHGPPSRDRQVGNESYRLLQRIWSSGCEFWVYIALTDLPQVPREKVTCSTKLRGRRRGPSSSVPWHQKHTGRTCLLPRHLRSRAVRARLRPARPKVRCPL